MVLLACGLVGVKLNGVSDININLQELTFFVLVAFVLLYIVAKVAVVVRWSLYWLYCALAVLWIFTGNVQVERS